MEIIKIPRIEIREIYIQKIRTWEQYPTILDIIDNIMRPSDAKKL